MGCGIDIMARRPCRHQDDHPVDNVISAGLLQLQRELAIEVMHLEARVIQIGESHQFRHTFTGINLSDRFVYRPLTAH
jgi:hypothetical protein